LAGRAARKKIYGINAQPFCNFTKIDIVDIAADHFSVWEVEFI